MFNQMKSKYLTKYERENAISNLFTTSRRASSHNRFSRCVCLRPNRDKLNKENEEQMGKIKSKCVVVQCALGVGRVCLSCEMIYMTSLRHLLSFYFNCHRIEHFFQPEIIFVDLLWFNLCAIEAQSFFLKNSLFLRIM